MMRRLLSLIAGKLPAGLIRRIGAWQWTGPLARRFTAAASGWIRNQDVVISHGVGKGLRFNAAGANPGYALGTTEPIVQKAVAELVRAGDVVYDIGANVGFYTVLLGRLTGPTGAVWAFEPLAQSAAAARRNAESNGFSQVTVINKAVGRRSGSISMVLGEESTWAKVADSGAQGPTISVEMTSIDELVDSGAIKPPNFVKIDVEGAELEVILGMRRTIERHQPVILCEMHGKNAEYQALMEELRYSVRALEEDRPLAQCHWDVHALAKPRR